MASLSFLNKERTIAKPGFNRWIVPPAALAIHLCIGMAYGFSVFWIPLSKSIGITKAMVCPETMGFFEKVFTTTCDWPISMLGWTFTMFFVFLGSSAAIFGSWVERSGPRKASVASAVLWCGGLVISAVGVLVHQIWLIWLGAGVIGGIGLGLGYLSPISTLLKWFPDKRGMAGGLAIMGFGGGAMVGAPLAETLMKHFATTTSAGVWQTFLVLAGVYFLFIMGGAFGYRVPPVDWKPEGWTPPVHKNKNSMITQGHVHVKTVLKTPQFWLVWGVICMNISAGIGIIGMASPMLQEIFGGKLIGVNLAYGDLNIEQLTQIATIGAGFAGLISLFNILGRFAWSSISDYIGRKNTFFIFFVLGIALYALIPTIRNTGSNALFVATFCVLVSIYGGGFATLPAYLADLFGTQMVSAIQGRVLTAWSTAGILGPVLVNYLREFQLARGVPVAQAYDLTMYILSGLLVIGFICNVFIKPVARKYFMTDEELAQERSLAHDKNSGIATTSTEEKAVTVKGNSKVIVYLAWLAVGIPMIYGFWNTIQKAVQLFQ
ncbi:MAG: OFA family MFS transporter [Anaerolineaceae bacterium]